MESRDFFLSTLDKPWNFAAASKNRVFDWEFVQANPQVPWHYPSLTYNPNITLDIVLANPDKKWALSHVYNNMGLTWERVLANPQIPWNYEVMSSAPFVTWDIISTHKAPWNLVLFGDGPNATRELWKAHPEIAVNSVTRIGKFMTFEEIIIRHNYEIECIDLSQNTLITWEQIRSHPWINWNYSSLEKNKIITWEIVRDNPQIRWELHSASPCVTPDIVLANPDYPWRHHLSKLNVPWEYTKDLEVYKHYLAIC